MGKINDKLLFDKIKWSPYYDYQKGEKKRHETQIEILNSDARDITICAGTRGGKSQLCAYIAFKHLLADNQRIWIVSLSYDMAKKVFNYVLDFAGRYDRRLLKGISMKPFPRFEVKEWNSWIECKSTDVPHTLMGEEINLAIMDEAARMKPDIWQRYISARLASRQGKSFVISTPFGQNWFYHRYLKTKQDENGASFHYQSKDNPYFPIDVWDRYKSELPQDIFDQEYKAEFLSEAASIFRGVDDIIRDDCLHEPIKGHLYYCGVDLAKHRDFTVISIVDATKFPHKLVYFDRFQEIEYPFQRKRIIAAAKKYRARIVVDSTAMGEAVSDDMKREYKGLVEDFKFTGQSKKAPIEKLSILIEHKKLFIPDKEVLIDELKSFSYIMTEAGNFRYSAPIGLHDDCVISLALAVWKLRGRKVSPTEPIVFTHPHY